MTNEEIVNEAREVREMNERKTREERMTPEEIATQQRANELVLRIANDADEPLAPIFYEALMAERRLAIDEKAESIADGARKAERARCLAMLHRCCDVYKRNRPPRIDPHEAFQKQTAIEYAIMVVGDWSVSKDFNPNIMPMPY